MLNSKRQYPNVRAGSQPMHRVFAYIPRGFMECHLSTIRPGGPARKTFCSFLNGAVNGAATEAVQARFSRWHTLYMPWQISMLPGSISIFALTLALSIFTHSLALAKHCADAASHAAPLAPFAGNVGMTTQYDGFLKDA